MLSIICREDGYTEKAYIAEFPRIHHAQRIEYRPMVHKQRYIVGHAIGTAKTPGASSDYICERIAEHVKAWDVVDKNGQAVPITLEEVVWLKAELIESMYSIISGRSGGDPDPDETTPEKSAIEAEFESLRTGKTIGQVKEETDLKN